MRLPLVMQAESVDIAAIEIDVDTAAPAAEAAAVPTMPPLLLLVMMSALGGIVAVRLKRNRSA